LAFSSAGRAPPPTTRNRPSRPFSICDPV
jgi:hypothetical protein